MLARLSVAVASPIPDSPLVDAVPVRVEAPLPVCPSQRSVACVRAAHRADLAPAFDCAVLDSGASAVLQRTSPVELPLRTVGGVELDEAFEAGIVRDPLARSAPPWLKAATAVRGVRWNGVYRPVGPWGVCGFWRWLAVRAVWPLVRAGMPLAAYQGFVDSSAARGPLFGLAVPVAAALALAYRGMAPLAWSLDDWLAGRVPVTSGRVAHSRFPGVSAVSSAVASASAA